MESDPPDQVRFIIGRGKKRNLFFFRRFDIFSCFPARARKPRRAEEAGKLNGVGPVEQFLFSRFEFADVP